MSDFLSRLAARSLGAPATVLPDLPPRFAPDDALPHTATWDGPPPDGAPHTAGAPSRESEPRPTPLPRAPTAAPTVPRAIDAPPGRGAASPGPPEEAAPTSGEPHAEAPRVTASFAPRSAPREAAPGPDDARDASGEMPDGAHATRPDAPPPPPDRTLTNHLPPSPRVEPPEGGRGSVPLRAAEASAGRPRFVRPEGAPPAGQVPFADGAPALEGVSFAPAARRDEALAEPTALGPVTPPREHSARRVASRRREEDASEHTRPQGFDAQVGDDPAPVIRVSIGRIEVRAAAPRSPSTPRPRAEPPRSTLDDYLRQRARGPAR